MVKHTQRIRWQQPTSCLSVLDHIMGLAFKGLNPTFSVLVLKIMNSQQLMSAKYHQWVFITTSWLSAWPIMERYDLRWPLILMLLWQIDRQWQFVLSRCSYSNCAAWKVPTSVVSPVCIFLHSGGMQKFIP